MAAREESSPPPAQVVADTGGRSLNWSQPSNRIFLPERFVTLHTRVIVKSFRSDLWSHHRGAMLGDLHSIQQCVKPSPQLRSLLTASS